MKKKTQAVEFLLDKYLDINVKDKIGNTPLHYAVILENDEIIELLLNKNADPFTQNIEGESPYDLATKKMKEKFNKYKQYNEADF